MQIEKHLEILKEVDATVAQALQSGSLLAHQRRLVAMLSLGAQQLVEVYLHRQHVIKPGAQVKHEWFGLGDRNLRIRLAAILTAKIEDLPSIWEILELAKEVEADRNDMVYGSPLADDRRMREKIDAYLQIKKLVNETHGA